MDRPTLLAWMKGNEWAASFLIAWREAMVAMDDLVDEEGTMLERSELAHICLERLYAGVFANPFFMEHSKTLLPLLIQGTMEWCNSNAQQTSSNENVNAVGFVRRQVNEPLVAWCAYLVGGRKWAKKISLLQVEYFHVGNETLSEWVAEVAPKEE